MAKHADPLRRRRVVVGLGSWLLFGFAWWRVSRDSPTAWLPELVVPAVAVVMVTVATWAWVRHNLGVYQRKGPRRGLPAAETPCRLDTLGRVVELGGSVDDARVVRIYLRGDVKRYEAAP